MKIIYLMRAELQIYPPCLSQILYLNSFGIEVVVAGGGCNQNVKEMLASRGIRYIDLELKRLANKYYGKLQNFWIYRKKAANLLKAEYKDDDIVWFGTADSGFLLRGVLKKEQLFVLNVLELYDKNAFYRRNIGKIIRDAHTVICCEQTRADIMKSWWNLEKRPVVLPNKPYTHPLERQLCGTIEETKTMIQKFSGRTSILYQGVFTSDRDVGKLAKGLSEIGLDIDLYLMGNDNKGAVEVIKKIYPNTIYLGSAPAPFHLEVTSHSMIGVALYDDSSLNNLFCAPNKIYEYCGFGIPVIGSDIPGIRNTIGNYRAGVCVDFDDIESIKRGLIAILEDYDSYSKNARAFFHAIDNEETMREVVERLGFPSKRGEMQ